MCTLLKTENLTYTTDKYETIGLEEYDNCDYVYKLNDVNTDDFVVLQLNMRGISSEKSQLIDLLDNTTIGKTPDVVILSETWLTPFLPDFSIPGYDFFQQCRLDKKGGGVGILVSQKIRCKLRPDLESKMHENECITLDITLKNGDHCLVSSMYRPPKWKCPKFPRLLQFHLMSNEKGKSQNNNNRPRS